MSVTFLKKYSLIVLFMLGLNFFEVKAINILIVKEPCRWISNQSILEENLKYLDLEFISCVCFEGDECRFVFKDRNDKELHFDWVLSRAFLNEGSHEANFIHETDKICSGLDRDPLAPYECLKGRMLRVYFDTSEKNPGSCRFVEEYGATCTVIRMIEFL